MSTQPSAMTPSSSAPPAVSGLRRNGAAVVVITQAFGSKIPPEAARRAVDESLVLSGRNFAGVPGSHRAEEGRTHYTAGTSVPDGTASPLPGTLEVLVTDAVEADRMAGSASTAQVALKMRTLAEGGKTIDLADARAVANTAFDIELERVAGALGVDAGSLGRSQRQEVVTDHEGEVLA